MDHLQINTNLRLLSLFDKLFALRNTIFRKQLSKYLPTEFFPTQKLFNNRLPQGKKGKKLKHPTISAKISKPAAI